MLVIIFTFITVTLLTYIYIKPLIDNLFYSVPYEPKFIHSYTPIFGFTFEVIKNPIEFIRSLYLKYGKTFVIYFSSKRFVYLYDEQTYLTKVAKSDDFTFFDAFIAEVFIKDLNVNPQYLFNEEYQDLQMKYFHQYLVGDELQILNKRVYDSLIESMKLDEKSLADKNNKNVNLFDHFGECMLLSVTESLFGNSFVTEQRNITPSFYKLFQAVNEAHMLGIYRIPFRSLIYRNLFRQRMEFLERFSTFKLNTGESKLIHALEECYHSDQYKHMFSQHDINSSYVSLLWLGMSFAAPMSCWSVVDLLIHPEALEAVKQELNENISSSSTLLYDKEVLAKLKVLDSCINETIRRVFQAVSVREVVVDTTIECLDKTKIGVRKGDIIIYPAFLKHFDPNLFGPNPYGYKYDRFIKKPNEPKAPSIMIFGCGAHTCPGRFTVMNQIKILVALIVQHMNIEFINMTENDKENYRNKLPYDCSTFVSGSGPKKGYEHKFDIKYSYHNLHTK